MVNMFNPISTTKSVHTDISPIVPLVLAMGYGCRVDTSLKLLIQSIRMIRQVHKGVRNRANKELNSGDGPRKEHLR